MTDAELMHYGILGMRWGKRKSSGGSKSTKPPSKKKPVRKESEDHKKKVLLKKKQIHEMSNEELRELSNRLQLEKNLRQLNPSKVQRGLNKVKKITAAGTTVAAFYALSKTPLAQDAAKAIKLAMSAK